MPDPTARQREVAVTTVEACLDVGDERGACWRCIARALAAEAERQREADARIVERCDEIEEVCKVGACDHEAGVADCLAAAIRAAREE